MALAAGARLGHYEIVSLIGAGGMGEVYRARDARLNRTVAIKVLLDDLSHEPDARTRFEREARAIAGLNHPHIATLHDIGRHEHIDFLVMEMLDGETLAEQLTRGPLPFPLALQHGIEIAAALDQAHRHGVTHRDLKPGNIMITRGGVKLLDFGLAKLRPSATAPAVSVAGTRTDRTAEGTILGTLQYMAPEQLDGPDADARTDIFAFGAVLHEMITGKTAFEGASRASLIGSILRDTPPPVSTVQPVAPVALDRLIATCLAKAPDDRWQSAGDLWRELKWIAVSPRVATPTEAVWKALPRWSAEPPLRPTESCGSQLLTVYPVPTGPGCGRRLRRMSRARLWCVLPAEGQRRHSGAERDVAQCRSRRSLEEALALAERMGYPDTHWIATSILQRLAGDRHGQEDYEGARPLFERLIPSLAAHDGPRARNTIVIAWHLFDCYLRLGDRNSAERTRREYLSWLEGLGDAELEPDLQWVRRDVLQRLSR